MEASTPNMLFSQSFRHFQQGEHVDEVRFSEPVVITACEILEQQTASFCKSISLTGSSAPALLDTQVAVTDHLVLRGTYDALTLVVYGNLASNIGQVKVDHDLESELPSLVSTDVSWRSEDLPEALHPQRVKFGTTIGPLKYLHLVQIEKENAKVILKVLQLAGQLGQASLDNQSLHKVVKSLVLAAASLYVSESGLPNLAFSDFWPTFSKPTTSKGSEQKKGLSVLLDAKKELCELLYRPQENQEEKAIGDAKIIQELNNRMDNEVSKKTEASDLVLELILHWIQDSVQSPDLQTKALLQVDSLIGGLAAVQLLCTDAQECYRFVFAGGLHLLLDVLQHAVGDFSATTLLALRALECASRYAFGCEALLGWWSPDAALHGETWESKRTCKGYSVLVKFLLQSRHRRVVRLAARVLHRLRAYELTAAIQPFMEILIREPARSARSHWEEEDKSKAVNKLTELIKQLLRLLTLREVSSKEDLSMRFSHWLDGEDGGTQLRPWATYGAAVITSSAISRQDIDPYLLSVLQERQLLPMLVTLLSAPRPHLFQGQAMNSCAELVGTIEALLLALLSCRSGLLFLAYDMEVSRTLFSAFQRLQELHENDLPPLRQAMAMTTAGFLCQPHDIGGMFKNCLCVLSAMDRLLGACQQSEESLWALWDLRTLSRVESGRQALFILTWFPEVMTLLLGSFHSSPDVSPALVFGETWRHAALHFVAEVLQVVVRDAAGSTVAAWTPHAVAMQRALLASGAQVDKSIPFNTGGFEMKGGACSDLLEWLDPAVAYHKKGAVGLLKYASALLSGGSVFSMIASGLPSVDNMDIDTNVGDQAVNSDLGNIAGPYQGKGMGTEVMAVPLTDTATVQMTVTFRILALVSCYPGMATVLYGEGAMAIVYSVLDQCATVLQSSSSAYDASLDEEDVEFDGTSEDFGDHAKERSLLGLLLPTLLFLSGLLQSLKVAVQNYRNTQLVDVLLLLHRQMSFRIASYVSAPPHAWSGSTLDCIAVRQVLASVLAYWPILGWTPPLFPRLLGLDNSSMMPNLVLPPMEPAATCSVLSLLVDMLPIECPQMSNSKGALSDMYRSLAVDNILGCDSALAVGWHTHSPHSDQFMQALVLYLDQISGLVAHHMYTVCGVLQDMLKLFIIRLACVSKDHAAIILRPIINRVRELSAPSVSVSENESLQLELIIQMVAGIAWHPTSKAVLLREGVIEVLLNACSFSKQQGIASESSEDCKSLPVRQCLWIARTFTALCDPDISSAPLSPLSRRIIEDCPSFGDCCSIVSCLISLLQVVPIGKDFEVVLEALEKLSSHKLGRTAVGYTCVRRQDVINTVEEVARDSGKSEPESLIERKEHQGSIFGDIWRRMLITLESGKDADILLIGIIRQFAMLAIVLSAAGKSACGRAALAYLFGIGWGSLTETFCEGKLESVVRIADTLRHYVTENGASKLSSPECTRSSSDPRPIIQEAHAALMTMLRIIRKSDTGKERIEKAILALGGETVAVAAPQISFQQKKWGPDSTFSTNLFWLTKEDVVASERNNCTSADFPPEQGAETCVLDSSGMREWQCPSITQERSILTRSLSKRKSMTMIEVSRKRYGMDISASAPPADGMPPNSTGSTPVSGRPLPASGASASVLNRRDTFRQRKPNTSRPPSMHVDDYVARERSEVNTSGSSPASIQRSASGSGRPPSIHVDEFMAKQQERQQLSVTSTVIEDHQLSILRNSDLSSVDVSRRRNSGLLRGTNKVLEEEAQRSTTPQDKGHEQQWEELSVAESTGNEVVEPSCPSASAPSITADNKSEKTSSSSSSMSTNTHSVCSGETPQVVDMLLQQSKITHQTNVARNLVGVVQAQAEELVQTVSSLAVEKHPAVPLLSNSDQARESQGLKILQLTTGFSPVCDVQVREAVSATQGLDPQISAHLSFARDIRQCPSFSLASRQLKELATPVIHNTKESPAKTLTKPPPFTGVLHLGPQVMQMNSPVTGLEQTSLQATLVSDPSSGPGRRVTSPSYAVDPRPRPPEKHVERTIADESRHVHSLPSAGPWSPGAGQTRLESALPSPLVCLLSVCPSAPASLPIQMPQWPSGEVIGKGIPLSSNSETLWLEHIPTAVYVDESGVPYSIPGRSTKPPGSASLPVGHGTPHHGTLQYPAAIPSPLSPPLKGGIVSPENLAGPGLPGSHTSSMGFSAQVQSYNALPSLLQPMGYIPPPVPTRKPNSPYGLSVPASNPAHQQQLHFHFQQNIMTLQQQQLQLRQHQVLQHAQPPQMQQLQHQQQLPGPVPMSVQVPLPAPPTAVAAPAPAALLPPSVPAMPQPQQLSQQQESSVMLHKMLASPDAIQALLKDQNKLRELLEKHPKLISLLQERMSQATI